MKSRIKFRARSASFAATITIAVAVACALGLAACGGEQSSVVSYQSSDWRGCQLQHQVTPPAVNQDSSADIAEILAAPVPEGVEPELWEMLSQELVRQVANRQANMYETCERQKWHIAWGTPFCCLSRHDDGETFVEWDNRFFHGDGNGDGRVDISDFVAIAIYYGREGESHPDAGVADYSWDGRIDISDITVLAIHYGEECSGFLIETSTEARRSGYKELAWVDYRELSDRNEYGYRSYRFTVPYAVTEPEWVRVTALDAQGAEIYSDVTVLSYIGYGNDHDRAPYFPVKDLTILSQSPPVITWSSSFFVCDGNQNGLVEISDVNLIAICYGHSVNETPYAALGDYDRNGIVDRMELECLFDHYGEDFVDFIVEVSASSSYEGFVEDDHGRYLSYSELPDSGVFYQWGYEIASAPESGTYWVRVTPYNSYGRLGLPCDPIEMGGEI